MSDSPEVANPTPKLSVHDNNIYSYEFDSRTSTLVLRTVYHAHAIVEHTDVWFLDVWCHHFENILGGDIIFDIEDSTVDLELERYGDLFSRLRNYGWPRVDWNKETLQEAVARRELRVWNIGSSYGIAGFVIAKEMRMTSRDAEAPPLAFPLEKSAG
jgi:hypothetical protein